MDIDSPPMPVSAWTFDAAFPLPYRVLVLVVIGLWAWTTNLHISSLLGIDPVALLAIHHNEKMRAYSLDLYTLCTAATIWVGVNLFIFLQITGGNDDVLMQYRVMPLICMLGMIGGLVCPFDVLCRRDRMRFLRALKRTALEGLSSQVFFSDIILGDYLTSFAKVFGDTWGSLCVMLFAASDQHMSDAAGRCFSDFMVPLVTSLPYVFRLRQCIAEYTHSNYKNQRHLYNACKYASSLPVILLSALQKAYVIREYAADNNHDDSKTWFGESALFRLWLLSVVVNSVFSFCWDIYQDWDLHPTIASPLHLRPAQSSEGLPNPVPSSSTSSSFASAYTHTQYLHFADPLPYRMAILLDFVLRFTWSIKLSSHLHAVHEIAQGVYMLEVLEILRRWMWCIFRLENKYMQSQNGIGNLNSTNGHALATVSLSSDASDDDEDSVRRVSPAMDQFRPIGSPAMDQFRPNGSKSHLRHQSVKDAVE